MLALFVRLVYNMCVSKKETKEYPMKVGDLVRSNGYLAIVICVNAHETLIKWLDDGIVEDADNYTTGLEVISESH
jgi:hypothetical protein